MRADRIAPATRLLAAAAAWAVLGAGLAAAGMGGRISPADAGSVAAQPLPQVAADAQAAAPAPYDAFAARPPFSQDRLPHPFVLPGGDSDAPRGNSGAFDYALTSVIITPRLRLAIVEPESGGESVRVREGETADGLGGWRLLELRPRAAVFEGPGGRRELALRVWAGGGDGAPAMPAPPPPPPAEDPADPARMPVSDADAPRPMSPQGVSPVPDAPPAAAPAADAGDAQQQMDAIRRRIEERRAQLRREAQQARPQDTSQAPPASNP